MTEAVALSPPLRGNLDDNAFAELRARVASRVHARLQAGPVFVTNVENMFGTYLAAFPESARQYHNCSACRTWINRYGSLAYVTPEGMLEPVAWDAADTEDGGWDERLAFALMARDIRRSTIRSPFAWSEELWGVPTTGDWHHYYARPPHVFSDVAGRKPHEWMSAKREAFETVSRALGEYPPVLIDQAVALLRSGALYRSEKVIGQAEWLQKLHAARAAVKGPNARDNMTWLAVATAPEGFCHPRASMIATLLEDLAQGMDATAAAERFAAKMNPLQYLRPQAPPAAGTIAQAEKLVAELGIAPALRRRFARPDEVVAIWRPEAGSAPPAGVFGHLRASKAPTNRLALNDPIAITWEKFARTVLPGVSRLEARAHDRAPFAALTTAVDADAPPILRWDRAEMRNPVAWYYWAGGGVLASQFGLTHGAYHEVTAIAHPPPMWYHAAPPGEPAGVFLMLAGAADTRQPGLALFPETLRAELHGVRAVIEAHSRTAMLEGLDGPQAAGLLLHAAEPAWNIVLRAHKGGVAIDYLLQRWD